MATYPSQPPNYPPKITDQPLTVGVLSEVWFFLVALVAIAGYVAKQQFELAQNREQLREIETEMQALEKRLESKLAEARQMFSIELNKALDIHREFLEARFNLIIEKLNTRDAAIQTLKEQTDRQGKELREIGGYRHYKQSHPEQD